MKLYIHGLLCLICINLCLAEECSDICVVGCPDDIDVPHEEGVPRAIVTWTPPTFTDNNELQTTESNFPGSFFEIGTSTVVYTAFDPIEFQFDYCTFLVTITDETSPDLGECPNDIEIDADAELGTAVATFSLPEATDVIDDDVEITSSFDSGDSFAGNTVNTITVTATDDWGNEASCSFTVTVNDVTEPVLSDCPESPATVYTDDGEAFATVDPTPPSAWDAVEESVAVSSSASLPAQLATGSHTITFSATDTSSNTAECSVTYNVYDMEAPTMTNSPSVCGSNITLETDDNAATAADTFEIPMWSDNVDNPTEVDDCSGLVCTRESQEADESLLAKLDSEAEGHGHYADTPLVYETSGNALKLRFYTDGSVTHEGFYASWRIIGSGEHAPTSPVAYDICDESGSTLSDVEGIIIDGEGLYQDDLDCVVTIEGPEGSTIELTITMLDIENCCNGGDELLNGPGFCCDGLIIHELIAGYDVTTVDFPIGETTLSFGAYDSSMNEAEPCTATYTVVDDQDPEFDECDTEQIIVATDSGSSSATPVFPEYSASDNSGEEPTISNNADSGVFDYVDGTTAQVLEIIATDAAGNTAVCEVPVVVVDEDPPVFSGCASDDERVTLYVNTDDGDDKAAFDYTEPEASDNIGVVFSVSSHNSGDTFFYHNNPTLVTAFAVDAAGNGGICDFDVVVVDNQDPQWSNCPSDIMYTLSQYEGERMLMSWDEPSASDNVGVASTDSVFNSDDGYYSPGETTVTYTAMDSDDNTATCEFTVSVYDTTPPTVTGCPSDMMVYTDAGLATAEVGWMNPMVQDNADGSVAITLDTDGLTMPDDGNSTCSDTTLRASAMFAMDGVEGYIDFSQASSSSSTYVSVNLWGLGGDAGGWHVHVNSVPLPDNDEHFVCDADSVGGHWNPLNISGSCDSSDHSSCEVGDLSGKHGAFDTYESVENSFWDTNLPLWGENSIVGRSIVIHRANGERWVCSRIEEVYTIDEEQTCDNTAVFPLGSTTVTYQAPTDASGNTAYRGCSFTVTVEDNEDPVLHNCPLDIDQSLDTGVDTAYISFENPTVTDNVDGAYISVMSVPSGLVTDIADDSTSGTFSFEDSPIAVYMTPLDASGNSGNTCNFTITLDDDEAPSVSCPSDITLPTEAGSDSASVTWSEPTVSDNVGVDADTSYSSHMSGATFNIVNSPETVTYMFYDTSGNSASCSFVVTLVDEESPVLSGCPPEEGMSFSLDLGSDVAMISFASPTVSDNVDGIINVDNDFLEEMPYEHGIEHVLTFSATDAAGNSDSCSFSFMVYDEEFPVLSHCPSSVDTSTDDGLSTAQVEWEMVTATDNVAGVSVVSNYESGHDFPLGYTDVMIVATDTSGNTAECTFQVFVVDTEVPTFDGCPEDISTTTDDGEPVAVVVWDVPTASDNVGVDFEHSNSVPGDAFGVGSTDVFYEIEDAAGNENLCIFTVTVTDNEDPVLVGCLEGDIEMSTDIGESFATISWTVPSANDNVGATVMAADGQPSSGDQFELGTTTVSYTAMDDAGNTVSCSWNFVVSDTEQPVFDFCPDPITVAPEPFTLSADVSWTDPSAHAADNVGVVTITSTHSPGDRFDRGATAVLYTASDAVGNSAVCVILVTVIDTEAPFISECTSDLTVSTDAGSKKATVTWPDTTAEDNVEIASLSYSSDQGDRYKVGEYSITATVTDTSDNRAECTFTLTVVDEEAPTFGRCPEDMVVETEAGVSVATVMWDDVNAQDNVGIEETIRTHESGDAFEFGVTEVSIVVTDEAGNSASCEFMVEVIDNEAPTFDQCSDDITVELATGEATAAVTLVEPVASDNVALQTTTSSHSSGTEFYDIGVVGVSYTATDTSGHTSTCAFTITVVDTQAPVFGNCNGEVIMEYTEPGLSRAAVDFDIPTATDNSGVVSVTSSRESGHEFEFGDHEVHVIATDESGNSAECAIAISVMDMEGPVFTRCPDDIEETTAEGLNGREITWDKPKARDNIDERDVVIESSHARGDFFTVGTSYVMVNTTDLRGNVGEDLCTFTVTIVDDEPPTVNCPENIETGTDEDNMGALVDFEATAQDNDAVDMLMYGFGESEITGDFFPVGVTEVSAEAYDISGNSAQCSFTVTVVDVQNPHFDECPEDITVPAGNDGSRFVDVSFEVPVSFDNVGVVGDRATHPEGFGTFELGTTHVGFEVNDAAGNRATCDFRVDVEQPLCEPLDILYVLDGSGSYNPTEFELQREFVASSLESMRIAPDAIRVAIIEYSQDPVLVTNGFVTSTEEAMLSLTAMEQSKLGTATGIALTFAANLIATRDDTSRPVQTFILTDGASQDDVGPGALQLHDSGDVTVHGIGIGRGVNEEELELITGTNERMVLVELFEDISSESSYIHDVATAFCPGARQRDIPPHVFDRDDLVGMGLGDVLTCSHVADGVGCDGPVAQALCPVTCGVSNADSCADHAEAAAYVLMSENDYISPAFVCTDIAGSGMCDDALLGALCSTSCGVCDVPTETPETATPETETPETATPETETPETIMCVGKRNEADGSKCKCTGTCHACEIRGSQETCFECKKKDYLHDGSCVDACPSGLIPLGSKSKGRHCYDAGEETQVECKGSSLLSDDDVSCDCGRNCKQCLFSEDGMGACSVCKRERYLFNGECHRNCRHFDGFVESGDRSNGRECVPEGRRRRSANTMTSSTTTAVSGVSTMFAAFVAIIVVIVGAFMYTRNRSGKTEEEDLVKV